MSESIHLHKLHGKVLTVDDPETGGRKTLTGFTCSSYPDCDVCGEIPEKYHDEY